MKPAAEMIEGRIRECAYHIWEASGRPSGRDEEFWQRACEQMAIGDDAPNSKVNGHQRKSARSAQPTRRRSRKAS
jgi:Protein of unknown function (DUF2934)